MILIKNNCEVVKLMFFNKTISIGYISFRNYFKQAGNDKALASITIEQVPEVNEDSKINLTELFMHQTIYVYTVLAPDNIFVHRSLTISKY